MKRCLLLIIICMNFFLLLGCVTTRHKYSYKEDISPHSIYAKGYENMQNHNYVEAIKAFQYLKSKYPLEEKYIKFSNINLMYSYYQNNEISMALALAHQFLHLYPNSSQLASYVFYIMGVINFNNGRSFLHNYLPYNMSKHDLTPYITSIYYLRKSISIDSKSNFIEDSKRRIVFLNNVISNHEYHIAKFYFNRKAYVAAINRAKIIIEKYPQTSVIKKALVLLIRSYDNLKMPEMSKKYIKVLQVNYPDNEYYQLFRKE